MTQAVAVENLVKRFDDVEAVSGVSFEVRQGEFFGFLGPNGAGKTTTINMLTGLARPDSGHCPHRRHRLHQPRAAQHLIGVVPDESNLYPELTGSRTSVSARRSTAWQGERRKRARELLDELRVRPGRKPVRRLLQGA